MFPYPDETLFSLIASASDAPSLFIFDGRTRVEYSPVQLAVLVQFPNFIHDALCVMRVCSNSFSTNQKNGQTRNVGEARQERHEHISVFALINLDDEGRRLEMHIGQQVPHFPRIGRVELPSVSVS